MSGNIDMAADVVPGDVTIFAEGPQAAESNKAVVRRFVDELLNRNDIGAIGSIMAPNAVLEHPVLPKPIQGLDGIRRIIEEFHTASRTSAAASRRSSPRATTWPSTCCAKARTRAPIAPTNKQVYWTALNMVTVREGLIVRQRACDNVQKVLQAATTA